MKLHVQPCLKQARSVFSVFLAKDINIFLKQIADKFLPPVLGRGLTNASYSYSEGRIGGSGYTTVDVFFPSTKLVVLTRIDYLGRKEALR